MSKRLLLLALLAGCATPTTSTGAVKFGEGLPASVEADPAPTPAWTSRDPRTVPHASRSRQDRRSHAGTGSHLNWHALAKCESTNNPRAVSSSGTYRGLYQFDFRTWRSVGGSGDPAAASPAEQTHRAWLLFKARGRSPWPICGRHL